MKKAKKSDFIPYVVLAGIFVLLVFLNIFYLENWLDSDMAAEMIFSRLLSEENKIFSTENWYYSSEFRILYTHLIMAPLFRIFDSWHVVRALTNIIFYCLLYASYVYMMKPLKLKKRWTAWTGAVLLLPFSETLMTHMQIGNTYMSHVIIIFFVFGLYLRLCQREQNRKKGKTLLLMAVYCCLCVICGMSGVRYLLALHIPLILAAFWLLMGSQKMRNLRKNFTKGHIKELFCCREMMYLYYGLAGAVSAVGGYGVNTLLIAKKYVFQTYDSIDFVSIYKGVFGERLQNTFGSLMMLFGYISDKSVLSLRGIVTMISFVMLIMIIWFTYRCHALTEAEERKRAVGEAVTGHTEHLLMYRFFVSAFLFNTFVFLFTNSTVVDRYYITVLVFALPVIAVYFEKENLAFDRTVAGVLLAGCLMITVSKEVYSMITVNKNEEPAAVAEFLKENGYEFGYATYWNANIITELTDGRVEIANISDPMTMEYFKWSSPLKYYTEEYERRASFLLLTQEEAALYENALYETGNRKKERIYEKGDYVVFSYKEE